MKKHAKSIAVILTILLAASLIVIGAGQTSSVQAADPAQSIAGQKTGTVAARMVNVRSGPGISFSTLGQLRQGEAVEIVVAQGAWYQIVYAAATTGTGWVRADYVQLGQPARDGQATIQADEAPAVSGRIVFQTRNGGDIFIMNADGAGLHKLTTGFEPELSPDGTQVAFTRFSEPMGLYVIDADGSNERLVFGANRPRSATWTPDGQSIILEWSPSSTDCYATPFGCVTEEEWYERTGGQDCLPGRDQPMCLGDFQKISTYDTNLTLVDLSTAASRDLPASHTAVAPNQNAQNSQVLFLDKDGLTITHNAGNDPAQGVVHLPNLVGQAVFSPDGRFIYGMRKLHDHWEIWRWNADGSGAVAITTPQALASKPVNNVSPAISPDGQWIAFLTDRTGQWELWVMQSDGSSQRPLASQALRVVTFEYDNNHDRMIDWGR